MYRDVEEMLTRELREVADHVRVPPLPELPTAPPPARFAWQPMLVAAALVLVALATVASLLRMDDGQSPQPAPQPTNVVTDDATEAVPESIPTGPPTIPYIVDFVVYVGDEAHRGNPTAYLVEGTTDAWLSTSNEGYWFRDDRLRPIEGGAIDTPPRISPNGEYVAYLPTTGDMNGFQTDPAGEGMGLSVPVPVRDDDKALTRIGAVTDDGWVIASGRGVGVLWRPFVVDAEVVDLTQTAPGQQIWQNTAAGLVAFDATDGARGPDSGRVYLADLTGAGEISPIADLPNFATLDAAGDWVAWVPPGVIEGEVATFGEIQVRRISGGDEGVLVPPDGFVFQNADFSFEDNQFLVAPVTDGEEQGWARCSPALQECVLLDTPSANQ